MPQQREEGKRGLGAGLASTVDRIRRVLPIIAQRHKVMLLLALLIMVASGVLSTAVPVFFGTLVNRVADAFEGPHPEETFRVAVPLLLLIGAAYLLAQLLLIGQKCLVEAACTRIERDMTVVCISHVLKMGLGVLAGETVGAIQGRIARSVDGLVLFLTILFRDLTPILLGIGFALVYVFAVDYRIGLVMLASLPVAGFLALRQAAAEYGTRRALRRCREQLDGTVGERLGALEDIRATNTGSLEVDRIEDLTEKQRQQKMIMQRQEAVYEAGKALNEGAFNLLVLAVAIYLVSRHALYPFTGQPLQPGDLIVYAMLFTRVVGPLKSLWYMLDHLQGCNLSVDDLLQMLGQAPDPSFAYLESRKLTMQQRVAELYDWKERPLPGTGPEPRLVKGEPLLVISDLVVQYPGADRAARPALHGVSMTVAHGQTVGIAGTAGSGKSTWLKVLLRLVPPAAGTVHIGGVPLDTIDRATISRLFGYVSQTPFLFAGTIRENLCYGVPPAAEDAVRRAAQLANIHDEIMAMPAGYDSPVAERGRNLSGGQRQRIALARIFLKDPPILLLDEATSALDNLNEKAVRDALSATRAERTTIIVAHRLTTLNDADEILVFDQGRIVERGGYETLANGDGLFARLVQSAARHAVAAESVPRPGRAAVPGAPLKPPQAFGRFFVTAALGSGAMGTVYRAYDTTLFREVALKIPRAELLAAPGGANDFLAEARAAARLEHPNFCGIHDVGSEDGTPYLVLDYVEGQPLRPGWAGGDVNAAARLAHTLATALAAAHQRGVVHRDLKPANVLIRTDGTPVITDFGLALRLDAPDARPPAPGELEGTFPYMAPEQIDPNRAALGPASDVYALGVLLYEQLTGRPPFMAPSMRALFDRVLSEQPEPPSRHRPGLPAALDAICLRALGKAPSDRFADMTEFAGALADFLLAGAGASSLEPVAAATLVPPSVRPEVVRFAFLGMGSQAPTAAAGQDRLFLDVGNALGPAVLDHHHLAGALGSTASLVLTRPAFVTAAVNPHRRSEDGFTVVLHDYPDLDGVAAAFFALHYLAQGQFPAGAAELARYVDRIDAGYPGLTLAAPFSLYVAYRRLGERLSGWSWDSPAQRWQQQVREGLALLADVVRAAVETGCPLSEVDAFAGGDRFSAADRQTVVDDVKRYHAKLADPRCAARRARLLLPGRFGGPEPAETLLVRDVDGSDDPERCVFFKDWARSDAERCGKGEGFTGLSVFHSTPARRCILSVAPGRGVSLRGLGALLERAEAERRRQVFGMDDRQVDPATGTPRPPRTGYDNADPWYDGRAHGYTIVDAPRAGTLLQVEEIETIFLNFGGWDGPAEPLAR